MFKVKDANCVSLYGFKTDFGGGRSSGFALIYDSLNQFKKIEPKHRKLRVSDILLFRMVVPI
jgi:small subunit ribosomal protein S24e